jgi:hypothetical protein
MYLGNSILNPSDSMGESSNSLPQIASVGKEFAWSRGIGIDYSPIKTRSARKKANVEVPSTTDSTLSTDSGALRAVKAPARAK